MKILHVASFVGNVGDNSSHMGLRRLLSDMTGSPVVPTRLEIRRFYQRYARHDKRCFDHGFVAEANRHDLVIFGGGGFLDFSVGGSATGTTLDIELAVLDQITTPLVISSVGCVPHQEIPPGNVDKLRRFLDHVLQRSDVAIGLRNDGSAAVVERYLGRDYSAALETILDNAFFFRLNDVAQPLSAKPYVAINIAADQVGMVSARGEDEQSITRIYDELATITNYILTNTDFDVVFVPHIYKDLQGITEVLNRLDDYLIRARVLVAPHVQGDRGCEMIMSVYARAVFTLGMRFHANVCAVAMGCDVVGIAALPRVVAMYHSIGQPERAVLTEPGFARKVTGSLRAFDQNGVPQVGGLPLEEESRAFYAKALARI